MSIDPDKHCIRTVGSTIDACGVAKLENKTEKNIIFTIEKIVTR